MATKDRSILDRIITHIKRFMAFEDETYPLILALWILHTWTFSESFPRAPWVTPYLYVYSETPGAGKSTLIKILSKLARNSERAEDMTSAAMYRLISSVYPTLFIDEVDTVFNGAKHDDLRRTLNTGYEHGGFTYRVVGGDVEKFITFCPKLLAGIRSLTAELPETVQTRSIPIKLVSGDPPEEYYSFVAGPEAEEIQEEINAWVRANGEEIIGYMPKPSDSLKRRPFEISFPLLQIARVLGVEEETRRALTHLLAPPPKKEDEVTKMFRLIRTHFDTTNRGKAHSAELAALFGWSTKHLSEMLRPYGIAGGQTMSIKNCSCPEGSHAASGVAKGYLYSQFEDVWKVVLND